MVGADRLNGPAVTTFSPRVQQVQTEATAVHANKDFPLCTRQTVMVPFGTWLPLTITTDLNPCRMSSQPPEISCIPSWYMT